MNILMFIFSVFDTLLTAVSCDAVRGMEPPLQKDLVLLLKSMVSYLFVFQICFGYCFHFFW